METNKRNYKSYLLAVIIASVGVFFDQYTKFLAVVHLKNQDSISLIDGVFRLHYLENRGAAFGMMQGQKVFFLIGGVIILALITYFYVKMPHTKHFMPLRICMIGIAAGAIGNMIDRARLNYVIDFFYFELIDFPIFNVADIYVTVFAICLILLILFYYKDDDIELLFSLHKKGNHDDKRNHD